MVTFARAKEINARKLVEMSEPDLRALSVVLQQARVDAAKGLASWLKKIPRDQRDKKYTIHAHRALLAELDAAIATAKKLSPAVARDLKLETREAMGAQLQQMIQLVNAGQKKFRDAIQPLRIDVASHVVAEGKTLAERHAKSADRYSGRVRATMKQELAVGLIRGESVYEIARRLSGKLDRQMDGLSDQEIGAAYGDRHFFRSRFDAERLVRTEIVHASNEIVDDTLERENDRAGDDEERGGWLKKWDASMDGIVCDECADMDGEVVEAGAMFSCGLYGPPLHPNCRCSTLPWRASWGD